jgi:hypothetical protein
LTIKLRQSLSRDLKIAVKALDQPNLYGLSVASGKDLVAIEVCPVSIPGGLGCSDDRTVLTLSKTNGDRQFFGSSTPLLIKAGQSFSLFGMTQNGKTVYLRKVQFLPKST